MNAVFLFLLCLCSTVFVVSAAGPSKAAFVPPTLNVFTRAYNGLEGWVAKRKVNKDLDESAPKFVVGPDSDYAKSNKFDHSSWDAALKKYVTAGSVDEITTNVVDYPGMAKDPLFETYKTALAKADLDSLRESPNELLALYINAYNCLCIGHVTRYFLDNGELPKSVTDTSTVKGVEIWDLEAGIVGGEKLSLNDIEHKILRSLWDEPRVHASIVCASASCPNLRTEAFVASRLNSQMDEQTKTWVSDETKGVKVNNDTPPSFSRIFLWFQGDFEAQGGPVSFVSKYLPDEVVAKMIANGEVKSTNYFPYNWNLNTK